MKRKAGMAKILLKESGVCHWCGHRVKAKHATADHLKPISQGGSNAIANLVLAHRWCNGLRGDAPADKAREVIAYRRAGIGKIRSQQPALFRLAIEPGKMVELW